MFAPLFITVGPSVGGVSSQIDKDSGHPGRETLSAVILRIINSSICNSVAITILLFLYINIILYCCVTNYYGYDV